jgi:hypothetical protein
MLAIWEKEESHFHGFLKVTILFVWKYKILACLSADTGSLMMRCWMVETWLACTLYRMGALVASEMEIAVPYYPLQQLPELQSHPTGLC